MTLLKRPAFSRDLHSHSRYIARDNPEAARRLLVAAEETCAALARQPEMGHQESLRRQAGVRSWRIKGFENYLIFYGANPESVEILRLLYASRDLPRFFRKRPL